MISNPTRHSALKARWELWNIRLVGGPGQTCSWSDWELQTVAAKTCVFRINIFDNLPQVSVLTKPENPERTYADIRRTGELHQQAPETIYPQCWKTLNVRYNLQRAPSQFQSCIKQKEVFQYCLHVFIWQGNQSHSCLEIDAKVGKSKLRSGCKLSTYWSNKGVIYLHINKTNYIQHKKFNPKHSGLFQQVLLLQRN